MLQPLPWPSSTKEWNNSGCSQSTTFARILLFRMLKHLWDGYQTSQAYGLSFYPNNEPAASVSSFVDDLRTTTHRIDQTHVEIYKNMGDNLILDLEGLRAKVSKENIIPGRRPHPPSQHFSQKEAKSDKKTGSHRGHF